MRITRRTALLGAAASLLPLAAPAWADAVEVLEGPAFGSYWRLTLPSGADADACLHAVAGIVRAIDDAMSPYRPTTALSQFNRTPSLDWLPMPADLCTVAAAALAVAAHTGGAFDPTVGPLVGRYGFGPIHDGLTTGSYRDLAVGPDAVRKTATGITLDLCGIAKGYALDQVASALGALGVDAFLFELGGEVIARGLHPAGRPWRIGVEGPPQPATTIARIIRPAGMAVATSGSSVQSYELGGRLVTHVIDPRLHEPADGTVAAVTVIMPTGIAADAYATALMAMGAEQGPAFAEAARIAALFQLRQGDSITQVSTADFLDFVEV